VPVAGLNLADWSTNRPGAFMEVHIKEQVYAQSPGSDRASAYLFGPPSHRARSRSRSIL